MEENSVLLTQLQSLQSDFNSFRQQQILQAQVGLGFSRRDAFQSKIAFDHNCNQGTMNKQGLASALNALGVHTDAKHVDELFEEFDFDANSGLDLDEFRRLLRSSNRLYEWAKALPLHELLADAIPRKGGQDPLRVLSELTADEIRITCQAIQEGLIRMLYEACASLKEAFAATDKRAESGGGSKFNIVPLSCGRIEKFHGGFQERIGNNISFSSDH